jgi:hypothetical protein
VLIEELDPAQRNGGGGAGDLLLVGQVEEILAKLLPGQSVRTGVVMLGQLPDSGHVALLGSLPRSPAIAYPESSVVATVSLMNLLSGEGCSPPWRRF